MNILFARHGKTEWNENNKVCGTSDIPLSNEGVEQAKILAEKLLKENIDIIFSSPLSRALETSKIISSVCNAPIIIDNRLIEQDYGIYEGVCRQNEDFLNNKKNFAYKYPNGESMLQVATRVYPFIDEIKKKYPNKNILILSHGGICRVIKTYFCDMVNEDFFHYTLKNAEYEKYII
ncbi:MAG: histidine phosphatase family protein [Ruminococcus sp.]